MCVPLYYRIEDNFYLVSTYLSHLYHFVVEKHQKQLVPTYTNNLKEYIILQKTNYNINF